MKPWWSPTKCADQLHHVELKVWASGEPVSKTPITRDNLPRSAELQQPAAKCCHVARCKLGLAVVPIPGPTPQYIPAVAMVTCLVLLCSDCSGHTAPRRTTPHRALTLSPLTRTRVHIIKGKYANEMSLFMKVRQFLWSIWTPLLIKILIVSFRL